MINKLVGMKLETAKEFLKSNGVEFEIVPYNDKRMNAWDETLVLRATQNGDKITLVATNFLFSPDQANA